MVIARFDVVLATLDPTIGSEIQKTRPCLVVSPDVLNLHLNTVIIAPMTTQGQAYSFRVDCKFAGRNGSIALDQLRTIDRRRVIRKLGRLNSATSKHVLRVLREMFHE